MHRAISQRRLKPTPRRGLASVHRGPPRQRAPASCRQVEISHVPRCSLQGEMTCLGHGAPTYISSTRRMPACLPFNARSACGHGTRIMQPAPFSAHPKVKVDCSYDCSRLNTMLAKPWAASFSSPPLPLPPGLGSFAEAGAGSEGRQAAGSGQSTTGVLDAIF